MTAKRLFLAAVIAVSILAIYNGLIHIAAKKTQRQHLLAAIDRLPAETECVFLGNSLIEAGCDATAFHSAWPETNHSPVAINLGLGATTPVEHYLILKRAFSRPVHVKYVIYGFFDDQLTEPARGDWDDLVGNRAFSYYFPEDAAAFYAPGSRLAEWKMELIGHVPMLAERSSLWDKVELFRRRLDTVGMPKQKTNRFGRVADFNALEAGDIPSFTSRCDAILEGQQDFSAPVKAILQLAEAHDAKLFLVEMPMSPGHRQKFYSLPVWTEMRGHLQSLAAKYGAVYVAASDWIADGGSFEDTVHLNEQGARLFSAQLASTMARLVSNPTNGIAVVSKAPGAIAQSR